MKKEGLFNSVGEIMEKIITYENLRNFAYSNDKICKKPIRGIVVYFFGLGHMTMFNEDHDEAQYYGERGILYVVPYKNPWAWMNRQAVDFTDEIIDVLMTEYDLPENIPIVSSGRSMGGQSSLVYTAYAKRTPVACVGDCPVCDTVFHFTERDDLPRTLYSAVWGEDGTLNEALARISPLHIIDKMPRVKYRIFHCGADKLVNIDAHSKKFVAALFERGYDVTLDVVEGRGHCDLSLDAKIKFAKYITDSIEK